jgi:hypothetical protein
MHNLFHLQFFLIYKTWWPFKIYVISGLKAVTEKSLILSLWHYVKYMQKVSMKITF